MTSDELVERWMRIRQERDRVRRDRDARHCERAELVTRAYYGAVAEAQTDPLATFELPEPSQPEPCWKAARKWTGPTPHSDGGVFYLDPPIVAWCLPCQERQALNDQLRVLVRQHAGALRGLVARGKSLLRQSGER